MVTLVKCDDCIVDDTFDHGLLLPMLVYTSVYR